MPAFTLGGSSPTDMVDAPSFPYNDKLTQLDALIEFEGFPELTATYASLLPADEGGILGAFSGEASVTFLGFTFVKNSISRSLDIYRNIKPAPGNILKLPTITVTFGSSVKKRAEREIDLLDIADFSLGSPAPVFLTAIAEYVGLTYSGRSEKLRQTMANLVQAVHNLMFSSCFAVSALSKHCVGLTLHKLTRENFPPLTNLSLHLSHDLRKNHKKDR